MIDDYAGQVVANVFALRARSFEVLPNIFACCLPNPCGDLDENEMMLLAIHAQKMLESGQRILTRMLNAEELPPADVDTLAWLRSAAESFAASIEGLRESGQLWVPDVVKRELVPFEGELPF